MANDNHVGLKYLLKKFDLVIVVTVVYAWSDHSYIMHTSVHASSSVKGFS